MATNSPYNKELILQKLLKGGLKPHQLEQLMPKKEYARLCAEYAEQITGTKLPAIRSHSLDAEKMQGNIENMIGAAQVPIGIAGPLLINGRHYRGKALIPLATTEGALVASVNRGCSALNKSGGADVTVLKAEQTRAPLFEAENAQAAIRLASYVKKEFPELKKTGEKGSRFLQITEIKPHTYGNLTWLRIKADTGDAMGMNMLSIAAQKIAERIEKEAKGIKYLAVSGNMCVDKKPSALTLSEGRGRYAIAEATLPVPVVSEVLKTTPREMEKLNTAKNLIGSALAGSYGMNAHYANIAAALYLATGQDLGHIVEASHGITQMEATAAGLKVSVTMPALQVGTIGGGTALPTQQECIRLMGIRQGRPGEAANQLAEVICAAALAGEISLIAAHCSKQLVDAHIRLNRKNGG